MPRLEFFVVAESAAMDQVTNQASVFNILEEVRAEGFPFLIPQCVAMSLWRSEPGDADRDWQVILRIALPGSDPQDFSTNFRIAPTGLRHRIAQRLVGLLIQREGDLRFELLLNGQHIAEHIVTVLRAEAVDIPAEQSRSEGAA